MRAIHLIAGAVCFSLLPRISAQDVPADEVARAIDNLKHTVLVKIDSEVEITARAFTDAKNIDNSLFWSDLFRPFLDITLAVFSGLRSIPHLATGSVRNYLHSTISVAGTGKSYYAIYTSFDRFRQDGENLALAIDGPAYDSIVAAMLNRAEDTTTFFDYYLYKASIQNDLYGTITQNSPIRISHKSSAIDRMGGDVFNSVLEARSYIASQFTSLSAQMRQTQLPQQRINELVAFIEARRQDVLKSLSGPGLGVSHVAYNAYLLKGQSVVKRPVAYSLGTISQLEQWRLSVLDLFVQSAGYDSIDILSRLVEEASDVGADEALGAFTESVNLKLKVEAVVAGQASANIVLKDATSLRTKESSLE